MADLYSALELDAFFLHQFYASEDDLLIKFHVRDAIHQESARPVRSFENGDTVACVVELVGTGKARWAGSDDRDLFSCSCNRRMRLHVSALPCGLRQIPFIIPDRSGCKAVAAGTCTLAERGAHTSRKLRKSVRLPESSVCLLRMTLIEKIVKLRDQITQRTSCGTPSEEHSGLAERDSTVHTACSLCPCCFFALVHLMYFTVVADALFDITIRTGSSLVL